MKNKFTKKEHSSMQVEMEFIDGVANIGYGFKPPYSVSSEKLPNNIHKYRILHSITFFQITLLKPNKSGRVFTLGKIQGHIHYEVPLWENGEQVATCTWEDYYKD